MNSKDIKKYFSFLGVKENFIQKKLDVKYVIQKIIKLLGKKFLGAKISLANYQFIVAVIVAFFFKIQGLKKNFMKSFTLSIIEKKYIKT